MIRKKEFFTKVAILSTLFALVGCTPSLMKNPDVVAQSATLESTASLINSLPTLLPTSVPESTPAPKADSKEFELPIDGSGAIVLTKNDGSNNQWMFAMTGDRLFVKTSTTHDWSEGDESAKLFYAEDYFDYKILTNPASIIKNLNANKLARYINSMMSQGIQFNCDTGNEFKAEYKQPTPMFKSCKLQYDTSLWSLKTVSLALPQN